MNAELVLLYLSLLKQDNYKELVDSTSFYKLLGLQSNATKQEVETRYKLLKEKMKPDTYPSFSTNKERFLYLLDRIDQGYTAYIEGKSDLYVESSTSQHEFISEMKEHEFKPDVYVPYSPKPSHEFISEKKEPEFKPDPYIPYSSRKHHDFISEGPSGTSIMNQITTYDSEEIFKAGNDVKSSCVLIPVQEVDELSKKIIRVVIENVLKNVPMTSQEMVGEISSVIKKYSKGELQISDEEKKLK